MYCLIQTYNSETTESTGICVIISKQHCFSNVKMTREPNVYISTHIVKHKCSHNNDIDLQCPKRLNLFKGIFIGEDELCIPY